MNPWAIVIIVAALILVVTIAIASPFCSLTSDPQPRRHRRSGTRRRSRYPTVGAAPRMIWGSSSSASTSTPGGTDRPPRPVRQLGAWNEADGPIIDANTTAAPEHRATGCASLTLQGAQSGGQGLGHSAAC